MAKDVAVRELDQGNFPITNLGTPTAAGSATTTDNAAVPRANAGVGSPGTSFLAAPADHVHPASGGEVAGHTVTLTDVSEQSVAGPSETVIAEFPVDFTGAPGSITPTLAALVSVDAGMATFRLRVGVDPDIVTGPILATITTSSPTFELKASTEAAFLSPSGVSLVKITAASDDPAHTCRIRNKSVVLQGV